MATFSPLYPEEPLTQGWLIDGLMPQGQLVLLDGAPGVGKSMLAAHLAASLPNPSKRKILYITSDDQYDLRGLHLTAQQADHELIHEAEFTPPSSAGLENLPCIIKRFIAFLREHIQAEPHLLVIIDDLEELLQPHDCITSEQYRTLWNELRRLAEGCKCTLLIPRRQGLNETRQYGPYTRLGSEAARYILTMHWHPVHPNQRILSVAKNQTGPMGAQWHLHFATEGVIQLRKAAVHEHVRPAKSPQTWQPDTHHTQEMEAILDVVEQKMQGRPVPKQELLQHVTANGYSQRAFFRTMEYAKLPSCREGTVWCYAPSPTMMEKEPRRSPETMTRARGAQGGAMLSQCA